MNLSPGAAGDPEVQAARLLLARLGVTPEQLLGGPAAQASVPTFAQYIDLVSEVVTSGTRRAYAPYWNRVRDAWGDRRLDEPTVLEIKQLAEHTKTNAVVRKNARDGRSAAEHVVAALRCLYNYAIDEGILTKAQNTAARVTKPRRLASTRRALLPRQLAQINEVTATTGNDPELDCLLLRLHRDGMPQGRRARPSPTRPGPPAVPRAPTRKR